MWVEVTETTLGVSYVNTHDTGGSSQWCTVTAVTTSGQTDASVDAIPALNSVSGKRVTILAFAHIPDNAAERQQL